MSFYANKHDDFYPESTGYLLIWKAIQNLVMWWRKMKSAWVKSDLRAGRILFFCVIRHGRCYLRKHVCQGQPKHHCNPVTPFQMNFRRRDYHR